MKFINIFLIFLSIVVFAGVVFAASTPTPPIVLDDEIFTVIIPVPNPYYGAIVADYSNHANPNSVSASAIQNNAVSNLKIQDGAITSSKISIDTINNSHLQDDSISSAKIQDYSIIHGKLGLNSVLTENIDYEAVTQDDLAAGAVIDKKIGSFAVTNPKIADNAVSVNKLDILIALGQCPIDGANLQYDSVTNKLKWSQTAICGLTSNLSSSTISSASTLANFASPFNSCIKDVTHTINGIVCKGTPGIDNCTIKITLGNNSYSGYLFEIINKTIPANINGNPSNYEFNFNAGITNSYNYDYDLNVELTQATSGTYSTIEKNNNNVISKSGCSPVIDNFSFNETHNSDYCVMEFFGNFEADCIGSCYYELSLENNQVFNSSGSFNGTSNPISVSINPNYIPAAGDILNLEITSYSPGLIGLVTTQSISIVYPAPTPGVTCFFPRS